MNHHLFCLTLDTDPDGLSGKETNRRTLSWKGLEYARSLPEHLESLSDSLDLQIPVTWFVRADGQLRDRLGTPLYLLEKFESFWSEVIGRGHELGWHPHLYRQCEAADEPALITDDVEAGTEIERIWKDLAASPFALKAFRNGEGWHSAQTFAAVEKLGFVCDSTAIPGRRGGDRHPMNWIGAPNCPYFP